MIYPVILTGGSGTRLWPVSRKSFPKQFQNLGGDQTLLQNTVCRAVGPGFEAPLIMTGEDFRFIVGDQLADISVTPHLTLVEPQGRNTAPAILAATLALAQQAPTATVLVLPADHLIPDQTLFQERVRAALSAVQDGRIVTFGITPDRPETGFGYLRLEAALMDDGPIPLRAFVEKPDVATAKALVKSGQHLWNAGIFMFRADVMLAAFKTHAPNMIAPVQAALDQGQGDLGFTRLAADPWAQVADISIDYAIMEKVQNLSVQRFDGAWSDLGSWEGVARDLPHDANGMTLVGGSQAVECHNCLIYRTDDAPVVVGLGLKDTTVVVTKDAVLVADTLRSQDVAQVVDHLRTAGEIAATQTSQAHRPWGGYETLALGSRFQVKRIVVKPGGILSLQSHHHRSEHWVVVEGTAKVTIGDEVRLISENQSVYIPLGAPHRMENPGKLPMVLIEVQTGAYLGEDDIVRYEDSYGRQG